METREVKLFPAFTIKWYLFDGRVKIRSFLRLKFQEVYTGKYIKYAAFIYIKEVLNLYMKSVSNEEFLYFVPGSGDMDSISKVSNVYSLLPFFVSILFYIELSLKLLE